MTYFLKNKENILKSLTELIKIPSISTDAVQVDKALTYVLDVAESLGMKGSKLCEGSIGLIEIGQGSETLGILAHVDVVSPGNLDKWEVDPFSGIVTKDRIIGRGALDDKGPLIACLYALKAVVDSNKPLKKKVQIIIGTQEETEWTDIPKYVSRFKLPDFGFTPDGEFPICNIEKGCYDIVMKFPLEGESYKNPSNSTSSIYVQEISAGTAINVVPGFCSVRLSNGENLVAMGKAVHSCQPEKGENAIFAMVDKLSKEGAVRNRIYHIISSLKDYFGDFYGVKMGIGPKEEYYCNEYIHKNVFTPTILETIGDEVKVFVNVRFAYTTSKEELDVAFEKFSETLGGQILKIDSLPPVYVSQRSPFLGKLAEAYEEETSFKNHFDLGYGCSYAKAMPNIVSWGPILPGMEDTCHEENEYIKIEDFETCFNVYFKAIEKIAMCEDKLSK